MAIDILDEINSIQTKTDGEEIIAAVASAIGKLKIFARDVDVADDLTVMSTSLYGKEIRDAITHALDELYAYDGSPIIAITPDDYDESLLYVNRVYGVCKDDALTFVPSVRMKYNDESVWPVDDQLCFAYYDTNSIADLDRLGDAYNICKNQSHVTWSIVFGKDLSVFNSGGSLEYPLPRRWHHILVNSRCNKILSTTKFLDLDAGCGTLGQTHMSSFVSLEKLVIGDNESNTILQDAFSSCKNLKSVKIKMIEGSISGYEWYPWGAPEDCVFEWSES